MAWKVLGCYESVVKLFQYLPQSYILQQACVTMVGLVSSSTDHSPSVSWHLRFVLCTNVGKSLSDLSTHSDIMWGVVMLWEYWETVPIHPTKRTLASVTMVGLTSTSTSHSSTKSGPLRLCLCSDAVQFLRCSSTLWWHLRCYGAMRVLWTFSQPQSHPTTWLGDNGWPCFHLNWSLFLRKLASSQIWLGLLPGMLKHLWVVWVLGDGMESVVMLWQCYESFFMPLSKLT